MDTAELGKVLCKAFCAGVTVTPLSLGYAVSSPFEDTSGDRITFYVTPQEDDFVIEDDGSYLAHLVAKDIPITTGTRGQLLESILSQGNAFWDKDTYEIKTEAFPSEHLASRAIDFLSSMIRVRDLELMSREMIRSTFREDATRKIHLSFDSVAVITEDEPVSSEYTEFPADLVIRPTNDNPSARRGAVYFINTNDKLNEALLHQMELMANGTSDVEVIALIEEPEMKPLNRKRFQRAQNRALTMPIFRSDEEAAMGLIRRKLGLPRATVA